MADRVDEQPGRERRLMPRHPSKAVARIFRESDAMRLGIAGRVINVSVGGLAIRLESELELGEQIKIEIRNDLQRFQKQVRGVIRHTRKAAGSGVVAGIELYLRLTPLEVSLLTSRTPEDESSTEPIWV
jgi:hypothetical protein